MKMLMKTYRNHIMWVFDCILSRHIYRVEYNALEPTEKWGDYIYEVLFTKTKHKKVTAQEGIFIESVAGESQITFRGPYDPFEISFFVRFSESKPIPTSIPHEFSLLAYFAEPPYPDGTPYLVLRDHPVWYGLRDEVVAYNEKRKNVEKKCTDFHSFVDGLCDYYETVEEAVAAWPALRCLLPDDLQIQDLAFDGTPKALPDDVDVADLTAMIIRERLEV